MAAVHSTRDFLNGFVLIELDQRVAKRALRREHRLRLPDGDRWASAQVHAMLLVTRDTKGFVPRRSGCPDAISGLIQAAPPSCRWREPPSVIVIPFGDYDDRSRHFISLA